MNKIVSFVKEKKNAIKSWMYGIMATMTVGMTAVPAFCPPAGGVTVNTTTTDMGVLVGGIASVILQIFQYIGVLLLIWGVGQLVLAFKNEDADSKSRAMMLILASIALIGLKALLVGVGIIS